MLGRLATVLLALTVAACQGGPPPGVVTGTVLVGGVPVAGKAVKLLGSSSVAVTGSDGRYVFTGAPAQRYDGVQYVSTLDGPVDPLAEPKDYGLNEVAQWRSAAFTVDASHGREVPPFDVAYNGLLYPKNGLAIVINKATLLPFHWSVHPQGQKYRVRVVGPNGATVFTSSWDASPTANMGQDVAPGHYRWQVDIDGGAAGVGVSAARFVDLSAP